MIKSYDSEDSDYQETASSRKSSVDLQADFVQQHQQPKYQSHPLMYYQSQQQAITSQSALGQSPQLTYMYGLPGTDMSHFMPVSIEGHMPVTYSSQGSPLFHSGLLNVANMGGPLPSMHTTSHTTSVVASNDTKNSTLPVMSLNSSSSASLKTSASSHSQT